jgi:parallel beta-helix repeat protein
MQVEQYTDIITITTSGGDQENHATMTETGADTGVFAGAVATAYSPDDGVMPGDGILQIVCTETDTIAATYHDADDGTGRPATPSDTADTDCVAPVIDDVGVSDARYLTANITWNTDEAADSVVYYGTTVPPELTASDPTLVTSHSVKLVELLSDTTYYYAVASADEAGNQTMDDNNGEYYQFHSFVPTCYYVPDDFSTIQGAINAVLSGDIIIVRSGTYAENINFRGKAIKVRSNSGPEVTVIDGTGYGSVFTFDSGEGRHSRLEGFSVIDGGGAYFGRYGGGIYCIDSSSPTISDCIISGNTCDWYGGAVFCEHYSSPTITNCVISNNSAGKVGGGIYCRYNSSPTITSCTISDNVSSASAGGIYCADNSNLKITNCVIVGNKATGYKGGAIYCQNSSSPMITNCTISGNSALDTGGGIYCNQYSAPTILNTILWGNAPEEIDVGPYGSSAIVTYSDMKRGWEGTGNIDSDPLFMGGDDYHLSVGSPCIDSGDTYVPELPETDRDGQPRVTDGAVDMGAYEYAGAVLPVARFSAHPVSGTAPLDVFFTDESIGPIDSWEWDFGDGGTSAKQSPLYTFDTGGNFTVSLRVISPDGEDTETKAEYIEVVPFSIAADFSGNPTSGMPPLAVKFTDLSTGTVNMWEWDFDNDGTIDSNDQSPLFTYNTTGGFTVSLTVTGSGEQDTKLRENYITCMECVVDGDCDDGLYCNGIETCVDGTCVAGSDPCPGQGCDEENDGCVAGPTVVDNPDAEFVCKWGTSRSGGYEGDYRWHAKGDGSCTATWTPDIVDEGYYNVYAWWKASSNRATDAKYTIYYDGGSHIVEVNQEINGSQWNYLGNFPFAVGTSGYVVLSNDANQFVIADAIKFEFAGEAYEISGEITENGFGLDGVTVELTGLVNTSTVTSGGGLYCLTVTENGNYTVTPSLEGYKFTPPHRDVTVSDTDVSDQDFEATMTSYWVLDNPDAQFVFHWGTSPSGGYNGNYRWRASGDGSCTATWTPDLPSPETYNVYAYWRASPNRATDSPYTIYYDGGSETVRANQQINGYQWNLLGTYPFVAGTSGYVVLSNDANQYVIADAIKWEPVP